jgi:hypothetical protein
MHFLSRELCLREALCEDLMNASTGSLQDVVIDVLSIRPPGLAALLRLASLREEIAASVARFDAGSFGLYVARPLEGDTLVWISGFRPFHEPPVLELMYAVAPGEVKRGFATELSRTVI